MSIRIDPMIASTLRRCQELGNPLAFIRTHSNESFLVPCYKIVDNRLTPIAFSGPHLNQDEVIKIPDTLLQGEYTHPFTGTSFTGVDVVVYSTFLYPNQDLEPHRKMRKGTNEYGLPETNYDCQQCASRIASLQIIADIFSAFSPESPQAKLSTVISYCILEYIGVPTTPTPSEPPTPSPRPPSQTPLPSPRPPSRAPSRLDLDVSPTFQTGDFPVQFIGKVS